ncbi:MAG TPA: flagellar hook-associated protein FlgL [Pseudogracilibacillus sp.]|nr:flagellar hook-associated protein FlgL [Pseudogracilibacillus sp.]
MRITQTMLQDNMLRNLFASQKQMDKYFTQIYTGKKIQRPSDDPVIAMRGMSYRTELTEIEQYKRNASGIWKWMDHADDALDKATKAMHRMEELAVQAANDSMTPDERISIKREVEQLRDQMIDIANTSVNGRYIFNGTDTDIEPIQEGQIEAGAGRDKEVEVEIAKGIRIPVNISPDQMFDQELLNNMNKFIDALEHNNQAGIDQSIKELNGSMLKIVQGRAELGARMNRLELIEDRLEHQAIIAEDIMKTNEGVDFEETVTNLLTQEVIHRAALAAGSKIIQPSLVDFLR